jgi:hypothetical protein
MSVRADIPATGSMSREASILGMTLYNATDRELKSMHAAFAAGLGDGVPCGRLSAGKSRWQKRTGCIMQFWKPVLWARSF